MTPDRCPGCGAKLDPDMLACPNCPMSFPEDEAPPGLVNPLKQSRYWQFVFPVFFFGAIGLIIWSVATGLMRLGKSGEGESGSFLTEHTDGAGPASKPADPPPGGSSPGEAARPPKEKPADDDGMIMISHVDERGALNARRARRKGSVAAVVPVPTPRAPTEWRLRGTVYDLTTLKPLAGCMMSFTDEDANRTIKTRTDSAGRYRTIVPPLHEGSGYSVSIEKSGYAPNYLNPGTEGVREMDSGVRWGMARDLASTLTAVPATVESASSKPLITDFFLAPRL